MFTPLPRFCLLFLAAAMLSYGCQRNDSPQQDDAISGDPVAASRTATARRDSPDTVPTDGPDASEAPAQLSIGDPAPPLQLAHWVKGIPFQSFAPNHVYVVEFWATWCGPCKAGMPHISELQELYDGRVTFVGVTNEDQETVDGFLASKNPDDVVWDDIARYALALDTDDRGTSNAYMRAAGQSGIPTAFVVGKDGYIEWIGHPTSIDSILEEVVDDRWDRDAFAAQFARSQARQALMMNAIRLMRQNQYDEAQEAFRKIVEAEWDDPMTLNSLAWMLATGVPKEGRDLAFCEQVARRAMELTKESDSSILDTLANILHQQGKLDAAIEMQEKAVALDDNPVLRQALDAYLEERDGPRESADTGSEADESVPADETASPADETASPANEMDPESDESTR